MEDYFLLFLISLLPVALSVLIYLAGRTKAAQRIPYAVRQILIGILFGGLAVVGTECGIGIDGAVINARDASPVCAGLLFGAPAGIIAGVIGGVERWFAVFWGAGALLSVLSGREKKGARHDLKNISQSFQRWLLLCVTAGFLMTTVFTWALQTELA